MEDDQFRILLEYLHYSWTGYRKVRKGVKKRIQRHMQQLECRNVRDYIKILDVEPDARHACELHMTVSISRFFRDRRLWELLETKWLPQLVTTHSNLLKVWSAGCACGEEVYSFKIIWDQLGQQFEHLPVLEMLATDRHPHYLARARTAVYNRSGLKGVAPEGREIYFVSRKGRRQFALKDRLKDRIRWEIHHLATEPPAREFNIIFMRNNILTYYQAAAQRRILSSIISSLAPGGLLIIGCHEKLPFDPPGLRPMPELSYVFEKC